PAGHRLPDRATADVLVDAMPSGHNVGADGPYLPARAGADLQRRTGNRVPTPAQAADAPVDRVPIEALDNPRVARIVDSDVGRTAGHRAPRAGAADILIDPAAATNVVGSDGPDDGAAAIGVRREVMDGAGDCCPGAVEVAIGRAAAAIRYRHIGDEVHVGYALNRREDAEAKRVGGGCLAPRVVVVRVGLPENVR